MNSPKLSPDHEGDPYFDKRLYAPNPNEEKKELPDSKAEKTKPIVPGTPEWEAFKKHLASKGGNKKTAR